MKIRKIETDYNNKIFFNSFEKESNINNYLDFIASNNDNNLDAINRIAIDIDAQKQSFIGFGAALTEASGYSFSQLDENKKQEFIKDCFSEDGLNYNFMRLTIASSDFSLKSYSYSYKKDLRDFSCEKDEEYVLPFIREIQNYKRDLTFLASPWSPPRFMKSNKFLIFGGRLLEKYYPIYAKYLRKYIETYKSKGINIDYITIQNEPEASQVWESCRFTANQEANFAVNYLYPELKGNDLTTKILTWDHNKDNLFNRANEIMSYPNANAIIAGFGHHWYTGDYFENVSKTREKYSDKLIIHTEGCTGYSHFNPDDEIKNAEMYAHDIIGDLNAGANGYIDWNILLDYKGGPNHKKNYCNSPIMLNENASDYYKNLSYYYIKHFSNIIKQNAKALQISNTNQELEITAFINNDNSVAIIVLNKTNNYLAYNIKIDNITINDGIKAHSIISYLI